MTGKDEFDHESIQDRQSIKRYFDILIDGFETGRITFTSEKESVQLTPAELIRFSIKTRKKPGKSKLTIKLDWNDSTAEKKSDKNNAIHIASRR
jgi:amphi-Trp domain-containing protein